MQRRSASLLSLAAVGALALSACSGANTAGTEGGGTETGGTATTGTRQLNVLMVGNPQMNDIETMAPEHFEEVTGIKVNFTILPENELRDRVAQDVATQAGQYDVVTIGAYEGSVWTANDWLVNLQPYAEEDTEFDVEDILPAMKGVLSKDDDLYAVPFYGESAFTMYRQDLFDEYGLTMPDEPTWDEIYDLAADIDARDDDVSGICLRGLPGWGENMAVVGSMIGSFGGSFFDADWNAELTSEATTNAVEFYVDLVTNYGQTGAAESGFTECLNNFAQGRSAIWFDATSAANTVESPSSSTVVGQVGYADAPRDAARASWVWAWAWAIPQTTQHLEDAWTFISWASGKGYENAVGEELGWTRVPDGKRESTFEIPEYQEASAAYSEVMRAAIEQSDPTDCGVEPRPAPGCQYLAIPEFADLGTTIGQEISAAVAGQKSVADALATAQRLAEVVQADRQG